MKRIALIIAIVAALAAMISAETLVPASGSSVTVEGTSTLHAWKMEGKTIQGQISVASTLVQSPTADAWKAAGNQPAAVAVSIPVTSIRSEHDRMDSLMRDALKAKENPEIRYVMTAATLHDSAGATFTLKTVGKLTIAGVTRDVAMDVAGTRTGHGGFVLSGEAPVRMSDYGIKPPKAMMGTIRTGDEVKVTFRWVVAAANRSAR